MELMLASDGALAQVMPAILVQAAVGVAASVPFLRRPSANAGWMALTLWLAGAVTIAGQPVILPHGVVVGALSGSAQALELDDVLVVAWGASGTFLYMGYLYPARTTRQRQLRGALLLGHLLILLALLAFVGAACDDPQIVREGVWFPMRAGMPVAALIYSFIGKLYIGGMQVWACIGCWQAIRRLPFSAMRMAVVFGLCVAIAVQVQGTAVTIAQARGQQFFAPPNGQRLDLLWLSIGLLCPLAAFSAAGAVRRWQLLFLRRDLLSLRQRMIGSSTSAQRTDERVLSWARALAHPLAGVDQLSVELRDLLMSLYPIPTEATALAGVWLWQQPSERVQRLSERAIALLLLGATILGIEQHVVAPVPLDFPHLVLQRFPEDSDWNIPADARFFQALERLLEGKVPPAVCPLIGEGVRELRMQLQTEHSAEGVSVTESPGETIPARIEAWLGLVEMTQAGDSATPCEEIDRESGHWAWWHPPFRDVR